jgi:hypothetical protein
VQRQVSFEGLLAAVSVILGVPEADLVRARSGASLARQILAMLAVELRVASTKQLADDLGLAGPASVRVLARRGRVRVHDDPSVATFRAVVLRTLGYAVPGTGVTAPA